MKHHNLFLTLGILLVIILGSSYAYVESMTMEASIAQQAADKALSDSLLTHQATVDTIYNSLPLNVLNEIYFQIGDEAPKEYVVDEYLEHQDYYNNLD